MKSENQKKRKHMKKDEKGNYDIDGVSFDGENLVVASDQSDASPKSRHLEAEKIEENMQKKPKKVDRQKNIDSEEGATNKAESSESKTI